VLENTGVKAGKSGAGFHWLLQSSPIWRKEAEKGGADLTETLPGIKEKGQEQRQTPVFSLRRALPLW